MARPAPAVGALAVAAVLAATGVQAATYEAVLAEQKRIGAAAQVLSLDAPGRDRALGLPQRLDHMADRLRPALRDLNAKLGVPAPDAFAGRVRVGLDPGWGDAAPGSPGLVVASGPLRPDGSPPDATVTLGVAFVARSDFRSLALALGHAFGKVAAMDARRLGLDPALGGPAVSPGGLFWSTTPWPPAWRVTRGTGPAVLASQALPLTGGSVRAHALAGIPRAVQFSVRRVTNGRDGRLRGAGKRHRP